MNNKQLLLAVILLFAVAVVLSEPARASHIVAVKRDEALAASAAIRTPPNSFTPVPRPSGSLTLDPAMLETSPCDAAEARAHFVAASATWAPKLAAPVPLGYGYFVETAGGKAIICPGASGEDEYDAFVSGYEQTARAAIAANPRATVPPLVLFLHGGLVSGTSGFRTATNRLCDFFAPWRCDDPSKNSGDIYEDVIPNEPRLWSVLHGYPLFVIWNSGFGEAQKGTLFAPHEREASAHGWLSRLLTRPAAEESFNSDLVWHNSDKSPLLNHQEYLARTYNLTLPNLWLYMESEIADTFTPSQQNDRIGLRLVRDISRWHRDRVQFPGFKVVLVGHSMGSEYASWLIESYDLYERPQHADEEPIFDVIFMAPAVPYAVFERALRTNLIRHFRVFTMDDPHELADQLIPDNPLYKAGVRYDSSLLYFISGVLNPYPDYPLVGLNRYWNVYQNQYGCNYPKNLLLTDVQNRVSSWQNAFVLSPTGRGPDASPLGLRTDAIHHGDFGGDPATIQSILYLVNDEWNRPSIFTARSSGATRICSPKFMDSTTP